MLQKRALALALLAVACTTFGCHNNNAPPPTAPVAPPTPFNATNEKPAPAGTATGVDQQIKDAVEAALTAPIPRGMESPFPSHVSVLSVQIQDDIATIDFSPEFNKLANMGDTNESIAQHALQRTIAKFPGVNRMRVTVGGKPFESQVTDWNTPFLVRGETVDPPKPPDYDKQLKDSGSK